MSSLDRLGNSIRDVASVAGALQVAGVHLHAVRESVDTAAPFNAFFFVWANRFADLETVFARQRILGGLTRARALGKTLGRPKVAPDVVERIRAELAKGTAIVKTAKIVGAGVGTVQRIKKKPG